MGAEMGELPAFVLPTAGACSAMAAVIFYLLKHLASIYRQLGEAQAASSVAATGRAERAEDEVRRLELQCAELKQAQLDTAAEWARRAAAQVMIRRAFPEESAKHRWVEARIDEILAGGEMDVP